MIKLGVRRNLILLLFILPHSFSFSQVTVEIGESVITEIERINIENCDSLNKLPFGYPLSASPAEGIIVLISNNSDSVIMVQNPMGVKFKEDYSELISLQCHNSFIIELKKDKVINPLPNLRDFNLFPDEDFIIKPSEAIILKFFGIKWHGLDSVTNELVTTTFKFYYSNISVGDKGFISYKWPENERSIPVKFVWFPRK